MQMRSVYDGQGYGWYWMLVEMLYEEPTHKLNMQGKYVWNAFALQMNATAEQINAFVKDCICEFQLFESDDEYFWSNSVNRRVQERETRSKKARESANKRWNTNKQIQPQCNGNANASKSDAIKEKKGKEIKENKTTNNEQQFKNLISVFSNNIHMITPFEFESLKNWSEDIDPEAIEIAIQQAVKNGVRTLKYIEGILKKWQGTGVKTKQDAEAQIRDFEDKKNGKQLEQQQTKRENPQLQAEIDAAQYYIGIQYKTFLESEPTEPQKTEYLNSFQYPADVLKGALNKLGLVEYYIGG